MGVILKSDGRKEEIRPRDGHFTLLEISNLLDGLIVPHFVGEYWLFINVTGFKQGLSFNEPASALFNYPIAGSCFIALVDELPPQFFLSDKNETNIEDGPSTIERRNSPIENSSNKEESKSDKHYELCAQTYNKIFSKNRTNKNIKKRFLIITKNNETKDISNNISSQIEILNTLLNTFLHNEEYERCQRIVDLLKEY